jgi:YD repeat-containing protein
MKGLLVNVEVSQSENVYRFDWDQLDMTKEEFDSLSHKEQKDVVQKAVDDLPEQPYWIAQDFGSND